VGRDTDPDVVEVAEDDGKATNAPSVARLWKVLRWVPKLVSMSGNSALSVTGMPTAMRALAVGTASSPSRIIAIPILNRMAFSM